MTASARSALKSLAPTSAMAAVVLMSAPLVARAGTPINERAAADPNGSVEVSNVAGTVRVSGWDRSEVEVTGELGEGTERLEFVAGDKVTRVKVILPGRSRNVDDTDLVLRVPMASRVSVNTVSADIDVQGVTGAQRLESVSADIRTQAAAEDIECRSVSGDVSINGAGKKALVTVNTVSGDATALKVAGEVNASTVSGNLTLGLGQTARSRVRSTSGDLTIASVLAPDGRFDVESISGDVRFELHGPVDAEFDVSSFNGEIRNCFGPKPVSTSEYGPGTELRFREGGGAGRVRLKTLNGDIDLCRK